VPAVVRRLVEHRLPELVVAAVAGDSYVSHAAAAPGRLPGWLADAGRPALWVPIIHPCWSGGMPILVEGAPEPVPSADIQLRDPLTIGNRLR
jgi:hypothetical protein